MPISVMSMNEIAKHYDDTSGPLFCAKKDFVDEIVRYHELSRENNRENEIQIKYCR